MIADEDGNILDQLKFFEDPEDALSKIKSDWKPKGRVWSFTFDGQLALVYKDTFDKYHPGLLEIMPPAIYNASEYFMLPTYLIEEDFDPKKLSGYKVVDGEPKNERIIMWNNGNEEKTLNLRKSTPRIRTKNNIVRID